MRACGFLGRQLVLGAEARPVVGDAHLGQLAALRHGHLDTAIARRARLARRVRRVREQVAQHLREPHPDHRSQHRIRGRHHARARETQPIQLAPRDLRHHRREIHRLRALIRPPVVPAVAIRAEGVLETLFALLQLAYRAVDRSIGLNQKWGISEREFLGRVFAAVDLRGTKLAPVPPEGPPA